MFMSPRGIGKGGVESTDTFHLGHERGVQVQRWEAHGKAGLELECRLPPSCGNHYSELVIVSECVRTDGIALVIGSYPLVVVFNHRERAREFPGGTIT